jgi:hypothetical protein
MVMSDEMFVVLCPTELKEKVQFFARVQQSGAPASALHIQLYCSVREFCLKLLMTLQKRMVNRGALESRS